MLEEKEVLTYDLFVEEKNYLELQEEVAEYHIAIDDEYLPF